MKESLQTFLNTAKIVDSKKLENYIDDEDINVQSDGGFTALMKAVIWEEFEIAQKLIANGANLNLQTKNGDTALMFAVEIGDLPFVELLLNAGADEEIKNNEGKTAYDLCKNCKEILGKFGKLLPETDGEDDSDDKEDDDENLIGLIGKTEFDMAKKKPDVQAPFLSRYPELPIRTLLDESKAYIAELSSYSKSIVTQYTGSAFKGMNKCLRKQKTGFDSSCNAELTELDRIIANGPQTKTPIVLLRSFDSDKSESQKLYKTLQSLKPGDMFEERAFMSTAYSNPASGLFAGSKCCIMKINVPVGVNVLAVETVSQYQTESEMLLSPGMGLQLTGTSKDAGGRTVYEFNCKYCLPSERFRSNAAPTQFLNVKSQKPQPSLVTYSLQPPVPGATRFLMLKSVNMMDNANINIMKQFAKQFNTSPSNIIIKFPESNDFNYFIERVSKRGVWTYTDGNIVIEGLSIQDYALVDSRFIFETLEEYEPGNPTFARGEIDKDTESKLLQLGFKSLLPSNVISPFKWLTRDVGGVVLHSARSLKTELGQVLVVDLIGPQSKLRPSFKRLPPVLAQSAVASKMYGFIGDPLQLERSLGCSLFTDGCVQEFNDFTTKDRFTVEQPLKQYLIILRHQLSSLVGKQVVLPVLQKATQVKYMIGGTTAINYWIQTIGGGKQNRLPVIPTEDYDIKMDMKQMPLLQSEMQKLITDINDELLLKLQQTTTYLTVTGLTFTWQQSPTSRWIAQIAVKELEQATNGKYKELMFPIIEFTPHTGIDRVDDYRIRLPNGLYFATPEYVRDDLCKGWGQKYKAERRIAKMRYWNMIFPKGHRLHQGAQFNANGSSCLK